MKGSKYKKTSLELLGQKKKLKGIVNDVQQENIKLQNQVNTLQIENEKLNSIKDKSEEEKRKEIYNEIYATKQEEMRINLKTEEKEAIKELQKQLEIKDKELEEKDKEKEELQRLNREQEEEIIRLKRELGLLKKNEVDNSPQEKSKYEMQKDNSEKKDKAKNGQNAKSNEETEKEDRGDEEKKEDVDCDKHDKEKSF